MCIELRACIARQSAWRAMKKCTFRLEGNYVISKRLWHLIYIFFSKWWSNSYPVTSQWTVALGDSCKIQAWTCPWRTYGACANCKLKFYCAPKTLVEICIFNVFNDKKLKKKKRKKFAAKFHKKGFFVDAAIFYHITVRQPVDKPKLELMLSVLNLWKPSLNVWPKWAVKVTLIRPVHIKRWM